MLAESMERLNWGRWQKPKGSKPFLFYLLHFTNKRITFSNEISKEKKDIITYSFFDTTPIVRIKRNQRIVGRSKPAEQIWEQGR